MAKDDAKDAKQREAQSEGTGSACNGSTTSWPTTSTQRWPTFR